MYIKPSIEQLRETFRYEPDTGYLFRRQPGKGRVLTRAAGYKSKLTTRSNYIQVYCFGKLWYAHIIIWAHFYGEWHSSIIDHVNNDGTDNRIVNLRPADKSQNGANSRKRKNNTSGLKGATYNKKANRYYSQIIKNGVHYYLGCYKTAKEAHEAYIYASSVLNGEFARRN